MENQELSLFPLTESEALEAQLTSGKDELNLAEFPLSLICRNPDPNIKVITFKDEVRDKTTGKMVTREVTIAGAADVGLPIPADEEVLLALIQITQMQGFTSKKVHFTRYQLLQILGWDDTGYYYERISNAFKKWLGVSIRWNNAWRNYTQDLQFGDKGTQLIQGYELRKRDKGNKDGDSYIIWADEFFESFRAGNLKGLDFATFRGLKKTISKRMFRFLDKVLYRTRTYAEFDLAEFAYQKIGMQTSYPLANIKQQFKSAIEELVAVGFIKFAPDDVRYRKVRAGKWKICFTKAEEANGQRQLPIDVEIVSELENDLVKRGVSRGRAKSFVAQYDSDHIQLKMEAFDFMLSQLPASQLPKNPGGYLANSITEDYQAPKGFASKAEQEKAAQDLAAKEAKKRATKEVAAKKEAQLKADKEAAHAERSRKVSEYLSSLPLEARQKVEADALSSSVFGRIAKDKMREVIIENHVAQLIGLCNV